MDEHQNFNEEEFLQKVEKAAGRGARKGKLLQTILSLIPTIFVIGLLVYYVLPIGKADVKRIGTDCTIVTYGRMVHEVLKAADALREEGISVEVIDLRTLLPMDKETVIESVKKTKRCVIVHEAVKTGGLGGEIAASICESDAFFYLDAPVRRLASEDVPVPFSAILEKGILPDVDKITACVREMVG